MSSGQTPRTPRYFPKMKSRGKLAKRMRAFYLVAGSFDRLGTDAESAARAFDTLSKLTSKKETNND